MKKLRKKTGESIAETLVAVLIMALAFVILTGAVAAAARVNSGAKKAENPVKIDALDSEPRKADIAVYIDGTQIVSGTVDIMLYHDDEKPNGYSYYEYKPSENTP